MKTLGLIGGTTWVSTSDYYKIINKEVNRRMGGHHSAKLILYSIDFEQVVKYQKAGNFHGIERILTGAAKTLASAGIDAIILCANTMHKYAAAVEEAAGLPLVHIADETASEIHRAGFSTVGLLGTKTTMSEPFYKERLKSHGIDVLVPDDTDQEYINRVIFDELAKDVFRDETKEEILRIMNTLHQRGARGIILGCTEIPLIIRPGHTDITLFDTLQIHALAAARFVAEA
jgi:aspartate racemase